MYESDLKRGQICTFYAAPGKTSSAEKLLIPSRHSLCGHRSQAWGWFTPPALLVGSAVTFVSPANFDSLRHSSSPFAVRSGWTWPSDPSAGRKPAPLRWAPTGSSSTRVPTVTRPFALPLISTGTWTSTRVRRQPGTPFGRAVTWLVRLMR